MQCSIQKTTKIINTEFDFTSELSEYWDDFWEKNDGLGCGGCDPDSKSKTLQMYHSVLWSKHLPNGEDMILIPKTDYANNLILTWKNFRFSSDSIIVSLRYKKYEDIIKQVMSCVDNYKMFYENFIRASYTIGGMIIFPKHQQSINQCRGTNAFISDRWDLTLECIRRYYIGEYSPLYDALKRDKEFLDLFVDFKGYVDFFYLQDMVNKDYSVVENWCGDFSFLESGLPKTVDDYLAFIEKEMSFLNKRNNRIKQTM